MSWNWPNFKPHELDCKDGTPFPVNDPDARAFMDKLQALRLHLGFPFVVTSGFRTPSYNASIGGATNSAHLKARAVDLSIYGERAYKLVAAAPSFGFTGIGVNQKSSLEVQRRFIHLDDLIGLARPTVWSY